jgi:hypothetical protein
VQYLGADSRLQVELGRGVRLAVTVPSATWNDADVGTAVDVAWPRAAVFAVVDDDEPEPDSLTNSDMNTFDNHEGERSNENQ